MGSLIIKRIKFSLKTFNRTFCTTGFQNVNRKPTAGIIVIGDEIIKGQVLDTNSQFLCKGLHDLGIQVARTVILPDNIDQIASEVKLFSDQYTYVLTSGGIGPTHDDLTYEAVAKAFNEPLILHPELMTIVQKYHKTPETIIAGQKLAMVPKSSKLTFGFDKNTGMRSNFPNVSVNNVYIFPGIPYFCRYLFSLVAKLQFGGSSVKFYFKSVYLGSTEVTIVKALNKLVVQHPNVDFGSYPEVENSYYKVKITMESQSEADVNVAYEALKSELRDHITTDFDPQPLTNVDQKIEKLLKELKSVRMESAYERIKSFDFGNTILWLQDDIESTAILHLCHGAKSSSKHKSKIMALYIEDQTHTKEQEKGLMKTVERYDLHLYKFDKTNLNQLSSFVKEKFFLMSTISQNKYGTLLDNNQFENPIHNWSKEDIVEFVRGLSVPCHLV